MTQRTRPITLHHLMAHAAGLPFSGLEFRRWKSQPPKRDSRAERSLRLAIGRTPDRPLDDKEAKGLRVKRVGLAAHSQKSPGRIDPGPIKKYVRDESKGPRGMKAVLVHGTEERTVPYYRRAMARFERWAGRAERLGLDKGRPPGHIGRYAREVAEMASAEGGAK